MPKLSAVIACRNAAPHLAQCLASAARHFDEVLFIDDGSSDNSAKIAAAFDHVQILPYDGFGNLALAKAHVASQTTGDYVQILDADDYLLDPRLDDRIAPFDDPRTALTMAPVRNLKSGGELRPFGNAWIVAVRQRIQCGGVLWRGQALRDAIRHPDLTFYPHMFELQILQHLIKQELANACAFSLPLDCPHLVAHVSGPCVAAYRADWSPNQAHHVSSETRSELLEEIAAELPLSLHSGPMEFFVSQRREALDSTLVS